MLSCWPAGLQRRAMGAHTHHAKPQMHIRVWRAKLQYLVTHGMPFFASKLEVLSRYL